MTATSPRLVSWEHGTDLVIEMPVARDVETVWDALTDGAGAGAWFAPFRLGEDADEVATPGSAADGSTDEESAEAEEPAARPITFELEDVDLIGAILSCEEYDHVLLELGDFGVLGIRLVPLDGETGEEAVLVFTQTAADAESARSQAADLGPMWDTHLRLFARSLGLDVAEATEPELNAIYSDLALETADSADTAEDGS
ncbi:hypothetical protein [Brevibacterium sp. S111]|uniref:hypothetical protein n=1 Tax=Brevibacterium sp. S111 TaxID=2483795 RepID=UPI0010814311|nr:hypothetical protein [Brevibacterium sp. S111]TGD10655.1 hypothetical protein EB836_10710 [Brevibacterium sp. S111]